MSASSMEAEESPGKLIGRECGPVGLLGVAEGIDAPTDAAADARGVEGDMEAASGDGGGMDAATFGLCGARDIPNQREDCAHGAPGPRASVETALSPHSI